MKAQSLVPESSRRVRILARVMPLTVTLAGALASVACGGEGMSDEELAAEMAEFDSVGAAFSQSSCGTATADQTFTGKVDPPHISPRSYNTCFKGYVVDINNLLSTYTGTGTVINARIAAHWADDPITDQTECESSELRGIFYKKVSGSWVVQEDDHVMGTWVAPFGGQCTFEVNLMGMTAGSSYRVAATARTPGGSTRKVSIGTYKKISF
jgi:hypothetical protein